MAQSNRKTPIARPYGRAVRESAGMRPNVEGLIDIVDQSDPAFMFIASELQRIRRTGGDLDRAAVSAAINIGREKYTKFIQDEADSQPGRIPASIVYYVQRGPLVKIGYTTQPHQRFADLLPDSILAWEPGGKPKEAARHQQFAGLRINIRAEYFRRDASLDSHIGSVRERHGAPDPTWPTIQNLAHKHRQLRLPDIPLTPHLVTLEAGTQLLGIRLGTARVWIHRGKLHHILEDPNGTRLYLLSDLKSLQSGGRKAPREEPEGSVA
jgi:hypothetical protein